MAPLAGFLVPAELAGQHEAELDRVAERSNARRSLHGGYSQFVVEPIFGYVSRNDSFLGTKSGERSRATNKPT